MGKAISNEVFSALQTEQPYKSYIKTILAKVLVRYFDSFESEPKEMFLQGNPRSKDNEDCIIDVWSKPEDQFLHRMNRYHFETGTLVEYTRPTEPKEKSPNEITDEEIIELLGKPFLSIQSVVNSMTSIVPIFRMKTIAEELGKKDKLIKFFEGKISELQEKEYGLDVDEE